MSWATAATIAASYWQNRQAKKRASEQMRFQENMSNTAYQRTMADMRAAGLNPILAAKLGGASTPPGAMAQTPDSGSHVAKGMQMKKLFELQDAQIDHIQSQSALNNAKADIEKQKARSDFGTHSSLLLEQQNKEVQQRIKSIHAQTENWKIKNTLQHWESNWYRNIYKAPQATLVARPLNYILSSAMSGLPEHERQRLLGNVHKGIKIMNDNVEYYMNNPQKLIDSIGTAAALLLTRSISQTLKIATGKKNAKKQN